jgi:hypothetical protein
MDRGKGFLDSSTKVLKVSGLLKIKKGITYSTAL